jgi:hypothetical protein
VIDVDATLREKFLNVAVDKPCVCAPPAHEGTRPGYCLTTATLGVAAPASSTATSVPSGNVPQ